MYKYYYKIRQLNQYNSGYELDNPFRFLAGGECANYPTFAPESIYGFSLRIMAKLYITLRSKMCRVLSPCPTYGKLSTKVNLSLLYFFICYIILIVY
jgi:hypothetical protein